MSFKEHFRRLDPRLLAVDKDTGQFNRDMALGKDYKMGLRTFLDG
jgi:hypothetical protein